MRLAGFPGRSCSEFDQRAARRCAQADGDGCQCPLTTNRVIESLFKDTDFPPAFYPRAAE